MYPRQPPPPPDCICRLLGEKAHEFFDEDEFTEMYPQRGRGAINPVVLCIVTLLQYFENLPDRAAAKMSIVRLDWMFATHQSPDWQGFDFSSLCNFRKRLTERSLPPDEQYVDQGYCHGETLRDGEKKGVGLLGPVGDWSRSVQSSRKRRSSGYR